MAILWTLSHVYRLECLNSFSPYFFGNPCHSVKIMGTRYNAVSSFKFRQPHKYEVIVANFHIFPHRHNLEGQRQKVRKKTGAFNIKLTELIMKDVHVPSDKQSGLKIRSLLAQKKPSFVIISTSL